MNVSSVTSTSTLVGKGRVTSKPRPSFSRRGFFAALLAPVVAPLVAKLLPLPAKPTGETIRVKTPIRYSHAWVENAPPFAADELERVFWTIPIVQITRDQFRLRFPS